MNVLTIGSGELLKYPKIVLKMRRKVRKALSFVPVIPKPVRVTNVMENFARSINQRHNATVKHVSIHGAITIGRVSRSRRPMENFVIRHHCLVLSVMLISVNNVFHLMKKSMMDALLGHLKWINVPISELEVNRAINVNRVNSMMRREKSVSLGAFGQGILK
jgi:hypothetical protein